MSVRIRLRRTGKKKKPSYRVVVIDQRKATDGKYIELIGFYDPMTDPSTIKIDNEKAVMWLKKGAQPSNTVQKLLTITGAWETFQSSKRQHGEE